MSDSAKRVWLVSADMGYGHQRAVYPLKHLAEEEIITVGSGKRISISERKLWQGMLNIYEFFFPGQGNSYHWFAAVFLARLDAENSLVLSIS